MLALSLAAGARLAYSQFDPPSSYYDAAIGKTGAALKVALHDIIKNQTVIPYTWTSTDTWDALKVLDEDPASSLNVVLIYSGYSALKSEQSNGTTGTWNREHLWPQSFGVSALSSSSQAKSDLFVLRPVDVGVNSSRGNKYYDTSTAPITFPSGAPASSYDADSWEPRDADKGAISRSLFYMAVRYDGTDADVPDLELSDTPDAAQYRFGKLTTLLAWHRQYFVTDPERQRNQRIYSDYQHNRNPFIDHPDYVDMVFNGVTPGQAWKDLRFTTAELGDSQISGYNADPDHDGFVNLLEYAFKREPQQAEPTPVLASSLVNDINGTGVLLSFPHNRNATDVELSYEGSADLQTWTQVTAQLVGTTIGSIETEQITVRISAPASPYFVRIRATRPAAPAPSLAATTAPGLSAKKLAERRALWKSLRKKRAGLVR